MRFSATVLLVACCTASLVGCCGRHHRHGCLFGDRYKHRHCVDRDKWDDCDHDDFDDDDRHNCGCGCHGGHMLPQYGMPMQSFDSGCGCGGGMPSYGGMPMSFDSFPQSNSCGCGAGGMSMPSYPTFDQPVIMQSPQPTPATPPPAPGAESYYSPKGLTPTPDQAANLPQRF